MITTPTSLCPPGNAPTLTRRIGNAEIPCPSTPGQGRPGLPVARSRTLAKRLWAIVLMAATMIVGRDLLRAATIYVPNGSFELPETSFADPRLAAWERAPEPSWYDDQDGTFPWYQVVGQFLNTSNGSP